MALPSRCHASLREKPSAFTDDLAEPKSHLPQVLHVHDVLIALKKSKPTPKPKSTGKSAAGSPQATTMLQQAIQALPAEWFPQPLAWTFQAIQQAWFN
jgi:hypothetical protein